MEIFCYVQTNEMSQQMILTSTKACTNVMNNKFDRLSLTEVQTYCDLIL